MLVGSIGSHFLASEQLVPISPGEEAHGCVLCSVPAGRLLWTLGGRARCPTGAEQSGLVRLAAVRAFSAERPPTPGQESVDEPRVSLHGAPGIFRAAEVREEKTKTCVTGVFDDVLSQEFQRHLEISGVAVRDDGLTVRPRPEGKSAARGRLIKCFGIRR